MHRSYLLIIILLLSLGGLRAQAADAPVAPPNFHEVVPGFHRGGSLSRANVEWLKQRGVRTIIKLDGKNPEESDFGLPVKQHYINGLGLNLNRRLIRRIFLDLDAALLVGPVYLHCEKGADRTGLVVALFRVANGWSPRAAFAEMYAPQYGHSRLQVWIDHKFWEYSRSISEILRVEPVGRSRDSEASAVWPGPVYQ